MKDMARQAPVPRSSLYNDRGPRYFSSERRDLIDRLTVDNTRSIIEIGCGDGSAGAYAKRQNKCGTYVGIEISPSAACIAELRLDRVYTNNIEHFDLPEPPGSFDVLIAGEVLEHLTDPWSVLRRLRSWLRPGALVMASSPNVAHYSVIKMLLTGDWALTDSGRMDRTHLRWFTPRSYTKMFQSCGFDVLSTEPLRQLGSKAGLISKLSGGRAEHLFVSQIVVIGKNAAEPESLARPADTSTSASIPASDQRNRRAP